MLGALSITAVSTSELAAEPVKHVCKTNVLGAEVRIVGKHGDLLEIHDTQVNRFYPAYDETLADMGGKTGYNKLNCGRVFSSDSMIAIVTGHNADLIQIYGAKRENGRLNLTQFRWLPHDYKIDVTPSNSNGTPSLKILRGKNRDAYWQICWDGKKFTQSISPNLFTRGFLECTGPLNGKAQKRKLTGISQPV